VADCGRSDKWLGPDRSAVTPTLDRLCSEGVSLPTTIVEKSCTTPSFTTLLTGMYSTRHGVHLVWGYKLADSIPMLTELLARRGYHCYAEMTGPMVPEMGLARGFEQYEYRAPKDYLHTAWGDTFVERLKSDHYKGPWFLMLHLWELHPDRQVLPEYDKPECGRDEYERSIASLDGQLARVFDAVGEDTVIIFTADHGEKTEAEEYQPDTAVDYARNLLNVDQAEGMVPSHVAAWAGPSVLQEFYGQCTPMMKDLKLRGATEEKPKFSRWKRLRDRLRLMRLMPMLYLQDLFNLAAPVKLTQLLKKRGLLDPERARAKMDNFVKSVGKSNLLEMHMRMWVNSYKNNMREGHVIHVYDFLTKIPLVIRWKGKLPGGVVHDRMVRQPDIMPTILDLLGIGLDEIGEIDGRSFRPLLEGRPWEPLPAYVSLTGLPVDLELRGVRTENHKYTYGPENDELPAELYDLRADPGETRNLASEQPERCQELRQLAESLLPASGQAPAELMTISPDQQKQIEEHLQDLGYIE
jgi:arylsulfatase A-like enzyme